VTPACPKQKIPDKNNPGTLAHILLLAVTAMLFACTYPGPAGDNYTLDARFAPCPDTPNCVSSAEQNPSRAGAWKLAMPPDQAWEKLQEVVNSMPRTQIIVADGYYLHATCRSRLLRFVDDLELAITDEGQLAYRSASRLGYSDLGVNQRRLDALYVQLKSRSVVQ
jgi:uncharacterized protein (DUF1499 family)